MNDFNRMMYALHDNGGAASLAKLCEVRPRFRDAIATAKEIVDSGLVTLEENGPSPVLRMTEQIKATMAQGRVDLVNMLFDEWEAL